MVEEKGRLYPVKEDGTYNSLFLRIKHGSFVIGSSEHCEVRIYIDAIFPEHCVLSVGKQGNVFLEPLHPSALTYINYVRITKKVCLNNNDIISVSKKDFRFVYPSNLFSTMGRNLSMLPYTKQVQSVQIIKNPALMNRMQIANPFIESTVPCKFHISKRLLQSVRNSVSNGILEHASKSLHNRFISEKKIPKRYNSLYLNKQLIGKSSHYTEESIDIERNFSLKLYKSFNLRGMLEIYNIDRFAFLKIFQSIWKYCIANVSEAVLIQNSPDVSLNFLNTKQNWRTKSVAPKKLMHKTFHEIPKNASIYIDTNLKVMNPNGMLHNSQKISKHFDNADFKKDKHNLNLKDTLISYKKRVSIAVKRYNLRKKRSTAMLKSSKSNSSEEFDDGYKVSPKLMAGCAKEQAQDPSPKGLKTPRKKRNYNKRNHNVSADKEDTSTVPLQKDSTEKTAKLIAGCTVKEVQDLSLNTLKTNRKERNYKKKNNKIPAEKEETSIGPIQRDCNGEEFTAKLMSGCAKEQVKDLSLNEFKTPRKKRNYNKKNHTYTHKASADNEEASIGPLQKDSNREELTAKLMNCCTEDQDMSLKELKTPRKKRNYIKKNHSVPANKEEASIVPLQKHSNKFLHETEKLNQPPCQRITRSMARSKSAFSN